MGNSPNNSKEILINKSKILILFYKLVFRLLIRRQLVKYVILLTRNEIIRNSLDIIGIFQWTKLLLIDLKISKNWIISNNSCTL